MSEAMTTTGPFLLNSSRRSALATAERMVVRLTRTALGGAVALLLLAEPPAVEAQKAGRVPKVGYVAVLPLECPLTPRREAFLQGLRDLGYVLGETIIVEHRCYMADDQLRRILSEFARLKIDVILAESPEQVRVARTATKDIPVVCAACGDPVANGLVPNLARPGGNVTGLATLSAELIGKRLELLHEAVPKAARVAALVYPRNPGTPPTLKALDVGARTMGIEIQRVEVRTVDDLENAFRSAATSGAGAVLVQDDPLARFARRQIADLALKHRLPSVAGAVENVEAGTLIGYGPDRVDLSRRAAAFVDKILKGTKAGDIPFEQPTTFELVVNMRTAKALGLTIPPALLLRADRVID